MIAVLASGTTPLSFQNKMQATEIIQLGNTFDMAADKMTHGTVKNCRGINCKSKNMRSRLQLFSQTYQTKYLVWKSSSFENYCLTFLINVKSFRKSYNSMERI